MCISKIALMWRTEMDVKLGQRVGDFIWEDASRKTRDEFRDFVLVRRLEDIGVDQEIVTEECELLRIAGISLISDPQGHALYFIFLNSPPTGSVIRYTN
jgi:hypothetical protein